MSTKKQQRKMNRKRVASHDQRQREAGFTRTNYRPYVPIEHKQDIEAEMRKTVENYLSSI